jgi:hypothetical protein
MSHVEYPGWREKARKSAGLAPLKSDGPAPVVIHPVQIPATKYARLRALAVHWRAVQAKIAPRPQRFARLATCRSCDFFEPQKYFGLGLCAAPGPCAHIRVAILAAKCPLAPPRWT